MGRSRSRSPTAKSNNKRDRRRSRSRSRERRKFPTRAKNGTEETLAQKNRGKKRSRSRSPRRRNSPQRHRSHSNSPRRRSRSRDRELDKGSQGRDIDESKLEGLDEEQVDMMKLMGFATFDTTKGKKVEGNDVSAVNLQRKRRYRQYMNRRGGFNRPLDFVA